jgi:hypothetical protein
VAVALGPGSNGGSSAWVLGRGPGEDTWRRLAELPGLVTAELLRDPRDLTRLVVVGHLADLVPPPVTWVGAVDWAP